MTVNIHQTALDEGGFLTKPAVAAMTASTGWRHMMVLIRCGNRRMSVAAEDVEHNITKIERDGDYVRDVCLIAGTLPTETARRAELRELLGEIR